MTEQTKKILGSRRFILYRDGERHKAEEVDILDFISDNSFYKDEIRNIARLDFNDTRRYGGGAAPPLVLERVRTHNESHLQSKDCGCS